MLRGLKELGMGFLGLGCRMAISSVGAHCSILQRLSTGNGSGELFHELLWLLIFR